MSVNRDREVRIGDRVRIAGGRYDERSGRVEGIKQADDPLFGTSPIAGIVDEAMALVKFDTVYGDGLDAAGVPVRRLKAI